MSGILREILNILWKLISWTYNFFVFGIALIFILYILYGFWKTPNWDILKEKKGIIKIIINILGMIISLTLFIGGIYLLFLAFNTHENILYNAFDVSVHKTEYGVFTDISEPYSAPILAYIYMGTAGIWIPLIIYLIEVYYKTSIWILGLKNEIKTKPKLKYAYNKIIIAFGVIGIIMVAFYHFFGWSNLDYYHVYFIFLFVYSFYIRGARSGMW